MARTGWRDKSEKEKLIHKIMHPTRMPVDVFIQDKKRVAELMENSRKLCKLIKEEEEEA